MEWSNDALVLIGLTIMMMEIAVAVPNAMMMGTMISMIVGIMMCGL